MCNRRFTHSIFLVGGDDFGEILCLCLALKTPVPSVSHPFFPSFLTISLSKPIGVVRSEHMDTHADQRREIYYYEPLGFSPHNIDLEFDEENMKAERLTKAPENAGIDPGTMKIMTWYQEPTRESDDSQLPSSSRASDALSGTDRTSYQVREPIEDDEERLAMKQGDMPPPVPERVANPRIRDDRAVQEFQRNSDKMHRATSDDAFTQAW